MSKETMTVYLVTFGEYEDYRVAGAFSSPEKAQPFFDYLSAKDENPDIEPFEMDTEQPKPLKTMFICEVRWDGSLVERSTKVDIDKDLWTDDPRNFFSFKGAADARGKAEKRKPSEGLNKGLMTC